MEHATIQRQSAGAESAAAFSRALDALGKKCGGDREDVTARLRGRDRVVWGRFRFELAREMVAIFTRRCPEIRQVYLWEQDAAEPEAADSPADPIIDLILSVDRDPPGIESLARVVSQELSARIAATLPGTPLMLVVHPVGPEENESGKGMGALLHAVHNPPTRVWTRR